jgi:hypothetical protein
MSIDAKLTLSALLVGGACAAGLISGVAWGRDTPVQPPATMAVIGTLTCSLGAKMRSAESSGAQGRDVRCWFRPGDNGAEETYIGTLQGVGKSDSLFGSGAVIMAVKAPFSMAISPGMLQQAYSADAARRSASAPLVGDRNERIVLQPLNEEEGRVAMGKQKPDGVIVVIELKLQSSPA